MGMPSSVRTVPLAGATSRHGVISKLSHFLNCRVRLSFCVAGWHVEVQGSVPTVTPWHWGIDPHPVSHFPALDPNNRTGPEHWLIHLPELQYSCPDPDNWFMTQEVPFQQLLFSQHALGWLSVSGAQNPLPHSSPAAHVSPGHLRQSPLQSTPVSPQFRARSVQCSQCVQ